MINGSVAKLLQIKNEKENEEITSFVKDLIEKLDSKDSYTKDVAVFRLSRFENSRQRVDNAFEDIRKIIPSTVAVISPPLNKVIDDLRLRKCSIVITVTDVLNAVSTLLIHCVFNLEA